MTKRLFEFFLLSTLSFVISSCAGSSHPRAITPSEGLMTPRHLELYSEAQMATLHFPRGVYELNAEDRIGYYYRAPHQIAEHVGGGTAWHNGGIFVSKRNAQKLRGYVYRAGTLTLVGNLSKTRYSVHD